MAQNPNYLVHPLLPKRPSVVEFWGDVFTCTYVHIHGILGCVSVNVCMCSRGKVYVGVYSVCVCVFARTRKHIYIYIYYM